MKKILLLTTILCTISFGQIARQPMMPAYAIFDTVTTVKAVIDTGYVKYRLGIGKILPNYQLDVSGQGRFTDTVRALAYVTTSDIELKENVRQITNWNLSNFDKVQPISYTFKRSVFAQYDSLGNEINTDYVNQMTATRQLGFSAQQFGEKIKGVEGEKTINQMELIIALWLKNQELEARIKALENK